MHTQPQPTRERKSNNPLIKSISQLGENANPEFFHIQNNDVRMFMGDIERKPVHSVVMTLDAPQGTGKTRSTFQFIRAFAESGYKCLFVSLEEHPESALFIDKRDEYLPKQLQSQVDTIGELPKGYDTLIEVAKDYDVVAIDSWGKIEGGKGKLDDFRKSANGKFFLVIFQRVSGDKMRGGSDSAFDADMICKAVKDENDYKNNYLYWDKNRYCKNQYYYLISDQICVENKPDE